MRQGYKAQILVRRKMKLLVLSAAMLVTASASVVNAEVEGNVTMASGYIWRGMDQSDNNPVIQGGYDLNFENGLYGGIWGSNIDDGDPAVNNNIEMDLYVGMKRSFGDYGLDLGYLRYEYPKASSDFKELFLQGNYKGLSATYYYNLTDSEDDQSYKQYMRAKAEFNLPAAMGLTLAIGQSQFEGEDVDNVVDYLLGFSKQAGDIKVGLAVTSSDIDFEDDADPDNDDDETDFLTVSVSKAL